MPRKSSGSTADRNPRTDLVSAASRLLKEHGPDALQARKVAAAAGTSTMAVYTYFGDMEGLITEVAEEGVRQFAKAQGAIAQTDDPVADFMVAGIAYRQFAIENPHMYRLMFGLTSAYGINAPRRSAFSTTNLTPGHPSATHLFLCVRRVLASRRIDGSPDDPVKVSTTAAKFWILMHGTVMLELAGFLGQDGIAPGQVLASMTTDLLIALGDTAENVDRSAKTATARIASASALRQQNRPRSPKTPGPTAVLRTT
jgi:AcrR family transcriptional regulator